MKRRDLYIMLSALLMTIVIYTCVRFTFPTNTQHDTTTPSTSTIIVETKLAKAQIYSNESSLEIDEAVKNRSFSSSEALNETVLAAMTDEDTSTNETVSIMSLDDKDTTGKVTEEEIAKKDTSDAKDDNAKASKKKDSKKKKEKDSKKKKAKKDKLVTILSIADEQCESTDVGISIADPYVNIRKKASTDSEIVGKLNKNAAVNILKKKKDWYYISSGNCKGYVSSEYIKTDLTEEEFDSYGTKVAVVTADGLNVRKKPDLESDRCDVVYLNESYPVLKEKGEWVKINIPDDHVKGYVLNEYVTLKITFDEAITIEEERALQRAEEEKKLAASSSNSTSNKGSSSTVQGPATNASTDEVKLLACLIQSEAGNQSYEGKLAVANVVLNRIRSSRYPNSMHNVIYQRGQFSVASSGSLQKQLNQYSNYSTNSQKLSIQAAKAALAGTNNIGNRLYFNGYRAAINAGKGGSSSVRIGDHLFW